VADGQGRVSAPATCDISYSFATICQGVPSATVDCRKMNKSYKRPPITEAVVEVRMASAIDAGLSQKLQNRLAERYPAPPQKTANISFELTETGANIRQDVSGFKILSGDGTFTVSVTNSAISTSRTPPYLGWEHFMEEARTNWADWKKTVGWKEIARIGLRYINRIDIPAEDGAEINLDDYLNFGLRRPAIPGFGPMVQFAANVEILMAEGPFRLILNSSPTPSPLVKKASFLLDLDLSIDQALPQSDEALWSLVEEFRPIKNSVFESCITDKTRSLLS
jgi:uncharacterized protein (TIGR04255 family)